MRRLSRLRIVPFLIGLSGLTGCFFLVDPARSPKVDFPQWVNLERGGPTAHLHFSGERFVPGGTSVTASVPGTKESGPASITIENLVVTKSGIDFDITAGDSVPLGNYGFLVSTPDGSTTVGLSVVAAPVAIATSVSPSTIVRGTSAKLIVIGKYLSTPKVIVLPPLHTVSVDSISTVGDTIVTARLTADSLAPIGPYTMLISSHGSSIVRELTIILPPPALVGISPNIGSQGSSGVFNITGRNFGPGTSIALSGTGVTVSDINVVAENLVTARITVASDAPLGARTLTASTSSGVSAGLTYTVIPPSPTLASLSPSSGAQGTAVGVTLTGTNFVAGATSVAVSGGGVTVSDVKVVSATSLTATLKLDANATLGGRAVTVRTIAGPSSAVTFTVLPPAPTLTNITPTVGIRTSFVPATLTGTNFISGATTVAVTGDGVTVDSVRVVDGTTVTALFVVSATASVSDRTVTVSTAGGTSNGVRYTVLAPAPRITGLTPNSGTTGTTTHVTIAGDNFVAGLTAVAVGLTGVRASSVDVVSPNVLTVDFTIAAGASAGNYSVVVSALGRSSSPATFTVNAPALALTNISPASGALGTTVNVTLTGSGFADDGSGSGGSNIFVSGADVIISNVNVVNDNVITAKFAISGGAALGARNVTVTNAGNTSTPVTFTITP